MRRVCRNAFLVLAAAAVVLCAVWGQLSDELSLLAVAAGALVAYLAFVSRYLFKDEQKLTRKILDSTWNVVLGTSGRAVVMVVLLLALDVWLGLRVAGQFGSVELVVTWQAPPLKHNVAADDAAFHVTVSGGTLEEQTQSMSQSPAVFKLPRSARGSALAVRVEHAGYVSTVEETKPGDLDAGVIVSLEPRPVLVVSVAEVVMGEREAEDFHVSAWFAGQDTPITKRPLPMTGVVFVAESGEDWHARLTDDRNSCQHLSPAIPIVGGVKSYQVSLGSPQMFPCEPVALASHPAGSNPVKRQVGVRRSTVDPAAFRRTVGETVPMEVANKFLFGGVPRSRGEGASDRVLERRGFLLSFNPDLRIPNWVGYRIVPKPTGELRRTRIAADPALAQSARASDYHRSGYNRGHLVPPADVASSGPDAVQQASYLSTMAPQTPVLNQGVWLSIETFARGWVAKARKWVCVAAGPAFSTSGVATPVAVRRIGEGGVAVPTHFWRVHTRLVDGRPDVLCFLVPNDSDLAKDPADYLVSLGEVERVTGLQFFTELPEDKQPDRAARPAELWAR